MARTTAEESRQVHLALLAATTLEIARHGYAGLRIPAVAQRVGKTQGSVYSRFPNKEALALAAVRHLRDEVVAPTIATHMAAAESPMQRLAAVSSAIADVAKAHPEGQLMFARLAVEMARESGPLAEEVRALFDMFSQTLESIVREGQQSGEIRPEIDAAKFAQAVVGLPLAFSTMGIMFPKRGEYAELEAALRDVLDRGVEAIPAKRGPDRS